MNDELALEAEGLEKSYDAKTVLAGIDLAVPRGEVFALLGPNGAGKTTTVRILATLVRPDGGRARVAGLDVVRDRGEVRRRISLTGQYTAIDELQTGRENLELLARLLGADRRAARVRAAALLDELDLVEAADRRVRTYSGGMRRRLDLAASLLGRPQVLFLDEPTTGLDPRSRQTVWELVSALAESGVTVLLTTQYLEEADRLAGRIAVLDGGRIIAEGTPEQLKRRAGEQRLDLHAADGATFDELAAELGARAVLADRSTLTVGVASDGSAAHVRTLLEQLDPRCRRIGRFSLRTASLDDVFLALTGRSTETTESEASHG